ncbi:unnamed protein product [Fusarium graminearum]|nr:unnamed protein product [Fusarium graminearum]
MDRTSYLNGNLLNMRDVSSLTSNLTGDKATGVLLDEPFVPFIETFDESDTDMSAAATLNVFNSEASTWRGAAT